MKIEFTSIESEPLLYFLLHSGVFVVVMGVLFFLLGIWFGSLTWGRYRRQNQWLRSEGDALRDEIAVLKRKVAEQATRPATSPLAAAPAVLLTEVLPNVSNIFPERVAAKHLPVSEETPAVPSLPFLPEPVPLNVELVKPESEPKIRSRVRSLAVHPLQRDAVKVETVEPFSFLVSDSQEPTTSEEITPELLQGVTSALSAIIAPVANTKTAVASAPPSVIPENDPALGLIFKEPPTDTDDLTRLQGISPILQTRLRELGIYRFQQIAAWNHYQVREFSRRLAFKDRIERERWVDQARRLMNGDPI